MQYLTSEASYFDLLQPGKCEEAAGVARAKSEPMSTSKAKLLLIAVFVARGTSFLFSKTLMLSMMPMSILAVRFILSFLVLAAVFFRKLTACSRASLKGGVILGILYTVCMIFEMYGLRLIDTGVSSLIENMAIVLVPIYVAALTRTMPKAKTMLCAGLAVAGVGFLSLAQSHLAGSGQPGSWQDGTPAAWGGGQPGQQGQPSGHVFGGQSQHQPD